LQEPSVLRHSFLFPPKDDRLSAIRHACTVSHPCQAAVDLSPSYLAQELPCLPLSLVLVDLHLFFPLWTKTIQSRLQAFSFLQTLSAASSLFLLRCRPKLRTAIYFAGRTSKLLGMVSLPSLVVLPKIHGWPQCFHQVIIFRTPPKTSIHLTGTFMGGRRRFSPFPLSRPPYKSRTFSRLRVIPHRISGGILFPIIDRHFQSC